MTAVTSRPRTAGRSVTGGWLLVAAQCALALWFACSVYLALTHAARFSGFLYIPSVGDPYTEAVDVTRGWAWAIPVTWALSTTPLLAGLSVVATVILLITRYARGRRFLTVMLVVGALVAVATGAALTPDVLSIVGWLSD